MNTKYNILAGLALSLTLAACGKSDKSASADKMSPDTSLASDLAAAGAPPAQPALADTGSAPKAPPVAATPPAATTAPAPAPAAETTAKQVAKAAPEHHRKPKSPTGGSAMGGTGTSAQPSGPTTTASGNTETHNGTGGGTVGTISAGTNIALTTDQRLCTDSNKVGDTFTATVANPVVGSNGAVIPAGSTVSGHVVALGASKAVGQTVTFSLAFDNLTVNGNGYPIEASMAGTPALAQHRTTAATTDAAKVGGGAVACAIIGGLIGHNVKGAVIGGAAGAAAGGGVAVATGRFDACLPQGGKLNIQLNSDRQIKS
jgi:type IV secretory pathway VirB10-like protein